MFNMIVAFYSEICVNYHHDNVDISYKQAVPSCTPRTAVSSDVMEFFDKVGYSQAKWRLCSKLLPCTEGLPA